MPYEIKKFKDGYKVCKKGGKKCFSNKPIPKDRAEAQMRALYASESLETKLHSVLFDDIY